jgi:hypothetical protein
MSGIYVRCAPNEVTRTKGEYRLARERVCMATRYHVTIQGQARFMNWIIGRWSMVLLWSDTAIRHILRNLVATESISGASYHGLVNEEASQYQHKTDLPLLVRTSQHLLWRSVPAKPNTGRQYTPRDNSQRLQQKSYKARTLVIGCAVNNMTISYPRRIRANSRKLRTFCCMC